ISASHSVYVRYTVFKNTSYILLNLAFIRLAYTINSTTAAVRPRCHYLFVLFHTFSPSSPVATFLPQTPNKFALSRRYNVWGKTATSYDASLRIASGKTHINESYSGTCSL